MNDAEELKKANDKIEELEKRLDAALNQLLVIGNYAHDKATPASNSEYELLTIRNSAYALLYSSPSQVV